jgi:transcriptional regulator with XRE-family HTH domain/nucleoside 2-deoxyribosyltransferase
MTFFERFSLLCEENNDKPHPVAKQLDIASGNVSNWKKLGSIPTGEVIIKIATHFDVSADYLLGLTDIRNKAGGKDEMHKYNPEKDVILKLWELAYKEYEAEIKKIIKQKYKDNNYNALPQNIEEEINKKLKVGFDKSKNTILPECQRQWEKRYDQKTKINQNTAEYSIYIFDDTSPALSAKKNNAIIEINRVSESWTSWIPGNATYEINPLCENAIKYCNKYAQIIIDEDDYQYRRWYRRMSTSSDGQTEHSEISKPSESNSVFIAMSFNPDLEILYQSAFVPLLSKVFNRYPDKLGRNDHNGIIDNEILKRIKECSFMIADITEYKHNVFYEAGYAHGLGIPVIFTCREDYFFDEQREKRKLPFDLDHRDIIYYKDLKELIKKLSQRIEKTRQIKIDQNKFDELLFDTPEYEDYALYQPPEQTSEEKSLLRIYRSSDNAKLKLIDTAYKLEQGSQLPSEELEQRSGTDD